MTTDYPDYTSAMQIIGSDVMVPIDIQGAYIMMPVDIQAQYITLEIDIVAQTVGNIAIDIAAQSVTNLNVNLAASAITMDINIKSITGGVTFNIGTITGTVTVSITGTANINIVTQSVALSSQAEWGAKQNKGIWYSYEVYLTLFGDVAYHEETIPAGKTAYMNFVSVVTKAAATANADLNQFGEFELDNITKGVACASLGSNGGMAVSLDTPALFAAGDTLRLTAYNRSNHAVYVKCFVSGYYE